jgi:hypothetical protein
VLEDGEEERRQEEPDGVERRQVGVGEPAATPAKSFRLNSALRTRSRLVPTEDPGR